MTDRLFPLDDIPEVPLLRVPRGSRGALISDERLGHDYPPEWDCCTRCGGQGWDVGHEDECYESGDCNCSGVQIECPDCLGMGSVKARVRLEAGHRCVRCGHPFMTKGDAKMLGVQPSGGRWSPCDDRCTHGAPIRVGPPDGPWVMPQNPVSIPDTLRWAAEQQRGRVEAEWRILTVHHLDGDKANLAWWNLVALCQRCHLEIQGRVVMERVYPHEHSEWFRPYVAGYYAKVYLDEDLTRDETMARLDELLNLERVA